MPGARFLVTSLPLAVLAAEPDGARDTPFAPMGTALLLCPAKKLHDALAPRIAPVAITLAQVKREPIQSLKRIRFELASAGTYFGSGLAPQLQPNGPGSPPRGAVAPSVAFGLGLRTAGRRASSLPDCTPV
jgi:hypothetical protein